MRSSSSSRMARPGQRKGLPCYTGLLLVAACFLSGCGGGGGIAVPPGGPGTAEAISPGELTWAQRVFELTNELREDHGLQPLEWAPHASIVAYEHAWDMHVRGYFAHANPEGERVEERLQRHGVPFDMAGENLARGHVSPEAVMAGWLASPSHRENLLYPGWTHVGVAVHTGDERGPWWGQVFIRRDTEDVPVEQTAND